MSPRTLGKTRMVVALLPMLLVWAAAARAQGPPPPPPPNPESLPVTPALPAPMMTAPPQPAPTLPLPPPTAPAPPEIRVPEAVLETGGRRGGGPLFGFLSPVIGQVPVSVRYEFNSFPSESVARQNADLGYIRQDFYLGGPFYQDCRNEVSGATYVRSELFDTSARIPGTTRRFPEELWDVNINTTYRHLFDNDWIGGVRVGFGSASDQPFSTVNELTFSTTAFLRIPQGERNAFLLSLSYTTNAEVFNYIPIPGIAYFWFPTDWFQATVGFPFADVVYRPFDDLTLQLSYAVLTNIHARAIYRLTPAARVYAAYDWDNENYFLAARPDVHDHFYYFNQKVTLGFQYNLARGVHLDVHGGYVFDRFYFEGRTINDDHNHRIDVGDGPYVGAHLQIRY
jgi:hypothetical protein